MKNYLKSFMSGPWAPALGFCATMGIGVATMVSMTGISTFFMCLAVCLGMTAIMRGINDVMK